MQVGQRVAIVGMAVSGALAVAKILAGLAGNSTATVADGFESAGDVFASGFVLLGLTLAAKPPDREHPYGHGRLEILTGLLIGLLLTAGGSLIAHRSLLGVGQSRVPPAAFVVWPLLASAILKAALSATKFHFGRRLRSAALTADAWNDCVDILSAVAALVAVGLSRLGPANFASADSWGGFAVGLIVVFSGVRVARETTMQLIDTMPDDSYMNAIREVALRMEGVRGVEKCFARKTGLQYHVDLHLEVAPEMTVRDSHDLAMRVRDEITRVLPWVADVLVHVEPSPIQSPGPVRPA